MLGPDDLASGRIIIIIVVVVHTTHATAVLLVFVVLMLVLFVLLVFLKLRVFLHEAAVMTAVALRRGFGWDRHQRSRCEDQQSHQRLEHLGYVEHRVLLLGCCKSMSALYAATLESPVSSRCDGGHQNALLPTELSEAAARERADGHNHLLAASHCGFPRAFTISIHPSHRL